MEPGGGTTWPSQVLGPRWEGVARAHLATVEEGMGPIDVVGATVIADPARKRSHEVDLLAVRDGRVVALGEAKLRMLDPAEPREAAADQGPARWPPGQSRSRLGHRR
jgi:hypothetical protein